MIGIKMDMDRIGILFNHVTPQILIMSLWVATVMIGIWMFIRELLKFAMILITIAMECGMTPLQWKHIIGIKIGMVTVLIGIHKLLACPPRTLLITMC